MTNVPDYTDEEEPRDQNAVNRLNTLILEMAKVELEAEQLEEQLKECKKHLSVYRENLVPELMSELGMSELTTVGGIKVKMTTELRGSLPKDEAKRAVAFEYLKNTGNDGLIKNEFKITYGRDGAKLADALESTLKSLNIEEHATVLRNETVNHQTMLAFLRRELAAGAPVPLDAFGTFEQRFAKIKR